MLKGSRFVLAALLFAFSLPAYAHHLQCVPYARSVSGIEIHGNANTWWDSAAGVYRRGDEPKVHSVLVFQSTRAMPLGHVAVVDKIIDDRHILLDHANWSRPGMIEHQALAVDISEAGDWSEVRVWYAPSDSLGQRSNPTLGFIYDAPSIPAERGDDGSQLASGADSANDETQATTAAQGADALAG